MKKINNHNFYHTSYKKHGVNAKGVHWNSTYTQELRFEVLIDLIKDELKDSTLCDVGCGFGHLINYFQEKNIYPKRYIGIDREAFMLKEASKKFPNSEFLQKNIIKEELPICDFYVCSGTFNTLTKNEIFMAIENCFNKSKKGLVFNFLTKAFIHDLNSFEVYLFCQKLTNNIDFFADYLDDDCTFYLRK